MFTENKQVSTLEIIPSIMCCERIIKIATHLQQLSEPLAECSVICDRVFAEVKLCEGLVFQQTLHEDFHICSPNALSSEIITDI